jgi:predicted dehydrogenase
VGLQGRQATSVKKIKELIEGGRIGEVLSSTWQGQGTNAGPTVTEGREYISDRTIGGNLVTIHFGHSVDYIQHSILPQPLLLPSKDLHED